MTTQNLPRGSCHELLVTCELLLSLRDVLNAQRGNLLACRSPHYVRDDNLYYARDDKLLYVCDKLQVMKSF